MTDIKYKIVGDRIEEIREVTVHEFTIGDVEDPDLFAAEPLHNWAQSPQGQWVIQNAYEIPVWHRMNDWDSFGHKYVIRAKFMGPALTEWLLKYGK